MRLIGLPSSAIAKRSGVIGYRDSAAIYLAMENGEVSGRTNELSSIRSTRPHWLARDGQYKLLLQYARANRLASLTDVPTARELAPDDKARALIQFTEAPFTMAWPYAAPPGLPADRSAALRLRRSSRVRTARSPRE